MIIEDNFSYFSLKPYIVTPHLNRLDKTVQMRGHNICFMWNKQKLSLIIIKYSILSRAKHKNSHTAASTTELLHLETFVCY